MSDPLAQRPPPPGLFSAASLPVPASPAAPAGKPPTPMQKRILIALHRLGGRAAIFEVAVEMRVPDHCISQRFSELVDNGHLILTQDIERRPISNKPCGVYELSSLASTTSAPSTQHPAQERSDL